MPSSVCCASCMPATTRSTSDELMGRGLTPADFTAYKSQRYRWAFGAMQILKARWHWMTERGPLTSGQRFHFLTGWFSWFADALHLAFTLMALTSKRPARSDCRNISTCRWICSFIPILGFFVFKAAFGIILYRVRVPLFVEGHLALRPSRAMAPALTRSHAAFTHLWPVEEMHMASSCAPQSRRMSKRPNPFAAVHEERFDVHRNRPGHLRHDARAWHRLSWMGIVLWIAILCAPGDSIRGQH